MLTLAMPDGVITSKAGRNPMGEGPTPQDVREDKRTRKLVRANMAAVLCVDMTNSVRH